MKRRACILASVALFALARIAAAQDDFLDALDDNLKFATADRSVTGRISGLFDLEEYYVQQPAPGLIYEDHSFLFNPRLTLNLDLQIGSQIYFFAQARADRGYDPSADSDGQIRADQYAVRYTPWDDNRFNVQAGKFATVIGTWSQRHDSWSSPFITAPVPYENQTGVWDFDAARNGATLNFWEKAGTKELQVPVIWGADYGTGASVFGTIGKFDYAAEIKNSSLSSRPDQWSITQKSFGNPTYSGRLAFRPDEAWNLGISSSVGSYLEPRAVQDGLAPGENLSDYAEITVAQDASFAWHHLQIWAECFETRFQVPTVGNCDTLAYYVEAKYKFTPEFSAALRWNQQLFNTVPDGFGHETTWGSDLGKIDAAVTYRFSSHMQAKLQYSFLDQDVPVRLQNNFVAAQFTIRF